ncbi:MAG: DUF3833 domain-containing protein [Betaproteobacteria bacterium]|nr:DUF3833 family protein [Betaproteobacteria bacterium]MDE2048722.1 DUF3833 domain-containing protein [Betaproteobacteria bacterium]
MTIRRWGAAVALGAALLLGGCASVDVRSYANEKPVLDLAQFFNGPVDAWGLVTDRSGKVVRRFTVRLVGTWSGSGDTQTGTLDEHFTYSDGKTEQRVWTLRKMPGGRYIGTAGDVVGEALGQAAGNALNWHYTLRLPVDGSVYDVQFDDWFYQMDDKVLLNRAQMSKFGIKLADITIAFRRP